MNERRRPAPEIPFKYRLVLKFDHGVERVVEGEYPAQARVDGIVADEEAGKTLRRIAHVLNTAEVRWPGDTVMAYIAALVTAGISKIAPQIQPYRRLLKVSERDANHRECQRQDAMFAHQLANAGGLLNEALAVIDAIAGPTVLGDRIRYFREHGRPKS